MFIRFPVSDLLKKGISQYFTGFSNDSCRYKKISSEINTYIPTDQNVLGICYLTHRAGGNDSVYVFKLVRP